MTPRQRIGSDPMARLYAWLEGEVFSEELTDFPLDVAEAQAEEIVQRIPLPWIGKIPLVGGVLRSWIGGKAVGAVRSWMDDRIPEPFPLALLREALLSADQEEAAAALRQTLEALEVDGLD